MLVLAKEKRSKMSLLFSCRRCKYRRRAVGLMPAIFKTVNHSPRRSVAIIGKAEQKLQTFPTVRIQCYKCGNRLAYTWVVQTRDLEQSSTQFFRCTKCSYTFRENS
ncbi:MAG: transcription factor S [Candidatus Bathyarchaeota archaeon]|nr:MAG: transcription factor S [Candidatus Bathyarchaeota archaeon]